MNGLTYNAACRALLSRGSKMLNVYRPNWPIGWRLEENFDTSHVPYFMIEDERATILPRDQDQTASDWIVLECKSIASRQEFEEALIELRFAAQAKKPSMGSTVARGAAMLAPIHRFSEYESSLIDKCDAFIDKLGRVHDSIGRSEPTHWQETVDKLQQECEQLDWVPIKSVGEID